MFNESSIERRVMRHKDGTAEHVSYVSGDFLKCWSILQVTCCNLVQVRGAYVTLRVYESGEFIEQIAMKINSQHGNFDNPIVTLWEKPCGFNVSYGKDGLIKSHVNSKPPYVIDSRIH